MLVTEKSSLSEIPGMGCGLRNASKIKRSKETVCFSFWKSGCEKGSKESGWRRRQEGCNTKYMARRRFKFREAWTPLQL